MRGVDEEIGDFAQIGVSVSDCLEIIIATKIKELREVPSVRLHHFGALLGKKRLF